MLPSNPRVLAVRPGPAFSVKDVHDGWVEGLTAVGCQVVDFNFDDRLNYHAAHPAIPDARTAAILAAESLEAACYQLWPHVVLVTSGFYLPPQTYERMTERGHKVVLHVTESPYEDDRHAPKAAYASLTLVNDPVNLHLYRQYGRAEYQPHCWRPSLHKPASDVPEFTSDFVFVGTGYPSRVAFFEQVDWPTSNVMFAGNWRDVGPPLDRWVVHDTGECLDNVDTARLYQSAKVGGNLYRKEATATFDGQAVGPREVEMAAIGLPFLREPRPESDRLFPNHPTFDTPEDFGRQLKRLLDDQPLQQRLSTEGRLAVADRSFVTAAKRLLQLLDKEK